MIGQMPSLWQDPAALIIGVGLIVGFIVGTVCYLVGHAHGVRDVERWQRRRP